MFAKSVETRKKDKNKKRHTFTCMPYLTSITNGIQFYFGILFHSSFFTPRMTMNVCILCLSYIIVDSGVDLMVLPIYILTEKRHERIVWHNNQTTQLDIV